MKNSPSHANTIVHRHRLYDVLDDHRASGISWVSGPPGGGKTTLLLGYLTDRELPCLWHPVESSDSDLPSFFYNLSRTVDDTIPGDNTFPTLSPEFSATPSVFSKRFFRTIVNRLPANMVLVFDNYQEVDKESEFHSVLADGLAELPPTMHIVFVSRSDPPPSWSKLRSERRIKFLDWDQIKFNLDETKSLAALSGGQSDLSDGLLDKLHAQCHGWAAGLILAFEGIGRRKLISQQQELSSLDSITGYFTEELYRDLSKSNRLLLLQLSILKSIYLDIAEQLTQTHNATILIEDLHRKNLFVEQHWQTDSIYRLHPLFRDYLLNQARREYDIDTWKQLHHRAAYLLAAKNLNDEAIELLVEAEAWTEAIELILKVAPFTIAQGRHATLRSWLAAVPVAESNSNPWFSYWLGVTEMFNSLKASRDHFETAYDRFSSQKERKGQLMSWSGVVEVSFAMWDNFSQIDIWIERLLSHLRETPVFPDIETEEDITANLLAVLLFRCPHHPEINSWAERAFKLIQKSDNTTRRLKLGYSTLHYYLFMGLLVKAHMVINELGSSDETLDLPPLVHNSWRTLKAAYYWHVCDSDQCLSEIQHGLACANEFGMHVWDARLHSQAIYLYLTTNKLDDAKPHFDAMTENLHSVLQMDRSLYYFLQGWREMLRGNDQQALQFTDQALVLALDTPWPESSVRFLRSAILYSLNQTTEAQAEWDIANSIAESMNSAELLICAQFLKADWALSEHDQCTAQAAIRFSFSVARENNIFNGTNWQHPMLIRLCALALRTNTEVSYVRKLIQLHNLLPGSEERSLEQWPWPVKIYCLNQFSIQVNNRPLTFGRKSQRKPLELLKFLISRGSNAVVESVIADNLWPDSDADAALEALTTTLYRLRKLPGFENALVRRAGTLTLDSQHCWVDVWAFKEATSELQNYRQSNRMDQSSIDKLTTGLALYQSDYLAQEQDEQYHIDMRERLSYQFLTGTLTIATHWQLKSDWDTAADWYERGLTIDNLAEPLYSGLMTCYLEQGRTAEARHVFRRCKRMLNANLGQEPSTAMQHLLAQCES